MRRRIADSLLELAQGDITRQTVDVVVNAANSRLVVGDGVDGAIHRAGGPTIQAETSRNFPDGCPTGGAVVSGAGNLSAKFIFHAVGPVWQGGKQGEPEQLQSVYQTCLQLALKHDCRSITFPAISTGIYGYPVDQAAMISLKTIVEFLRQSTSPLHVRIMLFSAGTYGAYCRVLEELLPG